MNTIPSMSEVLERSARRHCDRAEVLSQQTVELLAQQPGTEIGRLHRDMLAEFTSTSAEAQSSFAIIITALRALSVQIETVDARLRAMGH